MSRNIKPAKPLKGKNVSAVYLYVPPDVKDFWYSIYENEYSKAEDRPSISEFLSGIISQQLTSFAETGLHTITITCTSEDLEAWNEIRLDESPDPDDPQPWGEFFSSKVNAGINLLDEIHSTSPETGKLETEILELKEENVALLQQIADLKEQLKRKEFADQRLILKDSLIKIIATTDRPLRYVDIRQELNKRNISYSKDAVYPALTDLVADEIIKMSVEGNTEYFSKL